ncbi:hypothetical protein BJ322DRAFT_1184162 [Thelephora terrestris]|uniref:Uncharacterized protein n=1 Tax=Thelephora terrestris TaxID=56493 RepID=A0A9P6H2F7_9AGAM|nr:hypothetical protein BJ322DRAFT_1184162 [Thelephora terrestris]
MVLNSHALVTLQLFFTRLEVTTVQTVGLNDTTSVTLHHQRSSRYHFGQQLFVNPCRRRKHGGASSRRAISFSLVYALEGRLNVIMMGRPCPDPFCVRRYECAYWPVNAQAVVYLDKTSLAPINCLPPEILALIPTFRESEKVLINATASLEQDSLPWPKHHQSIRLFPTIPVAVHIRAHASQLLIPHIERISGSTLLIDNGSDLHETAVRLSKPAPLLKTVTLDFADRQGSIGQRVRRYKGDTMRQRSSGAVRSSAREKILERHFQREEIAGGNNPRTNVRVGQVGFRKRSRCGCRTVTGQPSTATGPRRF